MRLAQHFLCTWIDYSKVKSYKLEIELVIYVADAQERSHQGQYSTPVIMDEGVIGTALREYKLVPTKGPVYLSISPKSAFTLE